MAVHHELRRDNRLNQFQYRLRLAQERRMAGGAERGIDGSSALFTGLSHYHILNLERQCLIILTEKICCWMVEVRHLTERRHLRDRGTRFQFRRPMLLFFLGQVIIESSFGLEHDAHALFL